MGRLTKHESSRVSVLSPLVFAIGAAATSTLLASAAFACGGFFCNTQPNAPTVQQTGEGILFAAFEDGTMEAHVHVAYEGPSDEFAWIVPTPSLPEVGLSSDRIFDAMESAFGTQFQVDWQISRNCSTTRPSSGGGGGSGGSDVGIDVASDTGPSVRVVLQDDVGPYDYVVLQATDTAELFEWLNTNGYLIPDDVAPFVDPYVMMGNDVHFVAFRLTKTADAGDIQPIMLRYTADEPMVPIQLTAVAAAPNLGISVNVLGYDRAVPNNYLHVRINEVRIDWRNEGSNYDALVTEAMNEAGGQGFTTEYAGRSNRIQPWLVDESLLDIAGLAEITSRAEFMFELQIRSFTADSGMMGMLQQYMPIPDDVVERGTTAQLYYSCVICYGDDEPFDAVGLVAAIQERIVEPLLHARSLFEELPYLSRLYTTLSADEMTLDPSFVFNPDMGAVSNVRRATVAIDCSGGGTTTSNPASITLPDRRSWVVPVSGRNTGGWIAGMPAAEQYEETGSMGAPQVVVDNSAVIDERLSRHNQEFPAIVIPDPPADDGRNVGSRSGWGCSVGPRKTSTPLVALAGLALFAVRRRRR